MRYITLALALIVGLATAHGDLSHLKREIDSYNSFVKTRSISHCMSDPAYSKLHQAGVQRRSLVKRDITKALNTNHHSNLRVTKDEDPAILFRDSAKGIMHPEATEGPYYIQGEYVRYDISEDQEGVPFYVDLQIIDVNTCEPVPDAYIEFWGANATGVYSGVVAKGNGDIEDKSNVNKTFLRGVQPTDSTGVAIFKTIFPGYYSGRTTHVHIIAHTAHDVTVFPNGTISTDSLISHVGQFFFDESLRSLVEALPPYNTNTQKKIPNSRDYFINETATGDTDPFFSYAFLGDTVEDGVLAWITVGLDANAVKHVSPAGTIGHFLGTHLEGDGLVGGFDPNQDPRWENMTSPPFPVKRSVQVNSGTRLLEPRTNVVKGLWFLLAIRAVVGMLL